MNKTSNIYPTISWRTLLVKIQSWSLSPKAQTGDCRLRDGQCGAGWWGCWWWQYLNGAPSQYGWIMSWTFITLKSIAQDFFVKEKTPCFFCGPSDLYKGLISHFVGTSLRNSSPGACGRAAPDPSFQSSRAAAAKSGGSSGSACWAMGKDVLSRDYSTHHKS